MCCASLWGARTPQGAEIIAQGEEEAAEAQEEEDAPDRSNLRQIHEEERRHATPHQRSAVESKPGDKKPGDVEAPDHGDPCVADVPSKDALLDGMVDLLLGELGVPSEDKDWEERTREAYQAFRHLAHEHPNVFPLFVVRPPETMDGAWLVEEFLKTLRGAGFDVQTALHAFRALSSYTVGYVMAELRGFAMEPAGAISEPGSYPPKKFLTSPS